MINLLSLFVPNTLKIFAYLILSTYEFIFELYYQDYKNNKFMKNCDRWYIENMPTLPEELWKK